MNFLCSPPPLTNITKDLHDFQHRMAGDHPDLQEKLPVTNIDPEAHLETCFLEMSNLLKTKLLTKADARRIEQGTPQIRLCIDRSFRFLMSSPVSSLPRLFPR